MNYSNAALYAFLFKEQRRLSNAQCWKRFPTEEALTQAARQEGSLLETLSERFLMGDPLPGADGMICPFDPEFPVLNPAASLGDRPFLLFYRGNLSLLGDLNRNVAVIGTLDADDAIAARESAVVRRLVEERLNIVSGLAKGCDAIAHRACLDAGGGTIAILPSQLDKIYPAVNRGLAEEIVEKGGLLLTEYSGPAENRFDSMKRFTDRDRLQALFSKAVVLAASCRKGEGDSGSRYAMDSAKKYKIGRFVLFDGDKDSANPLFGLNRDLLSDGSGARVLRPSGIAALGEQDDPALSRKSGGGEQLSLLD